MPYRHCAVGLYFAFFLTIFTFFRKKTGKYLVERKNVRTFAPANERNAVDTMVP
jgi:hypothetical protein